MGPTATTSGASGFDLLGSCTNQFAGGIKEIPRSRFSKIWLSSGTVPPTLLLRSSAGRSRACGISERSVTDTLVILTCSGSTGLSMEPIGTAAILSNVSKLDSVISLPKTVYEPSRKIDSWCTIKNWEPALSGCSARAIETIPRSCFMSLNSAFRGCGGPPIPHVEGSPSIVFGSPPWIINPGIIL